uniref:Protein kinase domain-containing protein n=2 Tax=Caenorhabditis japonica TaxID=281687 RepID=A0A8R1DNI1_CAEJA
MGKHTKFDNSDDDESSHREKKEYHTEKKYEKRDRSRSPHEKRERSPRRDRHGDKDQTRHREDRDRADNGSRRDYGRNDRNNWKRERNDRRNDFHRKDEKNRLSADEIAAQKKALWGNKKAAEPAASNPEPTSTSSESTSSGGVAKNEKLWSSAIAATGVGSSQASKFMRLMGVKNAPKVTVCVFTQLSKFNILTGYSVIPLRWLSPEAIKDNTYSSKSDVWAFGVLLWEIATLGGFPYNNVADKDLLNQLTDGMRLEQPPKCSDDMYFLMKSCWNLRQEDRPSFVSILSKLDQISSSDSDTPPLDPSAKN